MNGTYKNALKTIVSRKRNYSITSPPSRRINFHSPFSPRLVRVYAASECLPRKMLLSQILINTRQHECEIHVRTYMAILANYKEIRKTTCSIARRQRKPKFNDKSFSRSCTYNFSIFTRCTNGDSSIILENHLTRPE